jgi:hypothetical protein
VTLLLLLAMLPRLLATLRKKLRSNSLPLERHLK